MDVSKATMAQEVVEAGLEPAVSPVRRHRPARQQDAWRKVHKLALRHLDHFISFEPKVLKGDDPDAIHDMRVASRRLQQLLDLIYPQPRPREVRRLRRRIRRCRLALGDVRNCDVLLGLVESSLHRKRVPRREAWTAVRDYLLERRVECFSKAMRKLGKVNLAILYVHSKEHLALARGASGRHAHLHAVSESPTVEPLPERVARALEAVWNAFEEKVTLSQGDRGAAVIHGVRIAAKRLRYLLEVLHAFDVPGSAGAVAWLRRLQQHLGDWHDLEVLEQVMVEMIARPDYLREHLPLIMAVEKLILRNRENKKQLEEKYFQMARESVELRRLKGWVGYLVTSPSAAFAKA